MKYSSIDLGTNVEIDPTSSFNNVRIGNNVKIAKRCSIFGAPDKQLEIGDNCYFGMNSIINGFGAKVVIGKNVSFAQNVNLMADSGPNASDKLQQVFPLIKGEIKIGDHCWIGASSIIMPGVNLGDFCIVAANSFVNNSFPPYTIIGGNPAKIIRKFSNEEIEKIEDKGEINDD